MENKVTEETSKKTETLKGRLGADPTIATINTKNGDKQVATFSVADNSSGAEKPTWTNVQVWEDKFPKDINAIKKGDLVELKGNVKSFETKSGPKQEFVVSEFVSHQSKVQAETVKERHTLKGNVGQEPVISEHAGKKVAAFSIAIKKEGSDQPTWQNVQVWESNIEKNKITDLKKGDFIELKGYYGKEYETKNQEKKQDFVLEESKLLKQAEKQEEKKSSGIKM